MAFNYLKYISKDPSASIHDIAKAAYEDGFKEGAARMASKISAEFAPDDEIQEIVEQLKEQKDGGV